MVKTFVPNLGVAGIVAIRPFISGPKSVQRHLVQFYEHKIYLHTSMRFGFPLGPASSTCMISPPPALPLTPTYLLLASSN
jgi:hypothetical protein